MNAMQILTKMVVIQCNGHASNALNDKKSINLYNGVVHMGLELSGMLLKIMDPLHSKNLLINKKWTHLFKCK